MNGNRSRTALLPVCWPVVSVLLLALVVRIAACVVWADDLTRDRDVYLGIAQEIARGHGFCTPGTTHPTAYRPPLYPLLLAAAITVLSPAVSVAAVNTLAGLAAVAITFQLARQCGCSDRGACLAALVVALDPLLVRYTARPMTECLFAALTTASLWLLVAAVSKPLAWREGISAGVVLGLAALCRPTVWPFIVGASLVVLALQLWRRSQDKRTVFAFVAAFWLVVAVTVAPWVARNQLQFGVPILTTTHGGYTLLMANNPVFYDVARRPWGATWDGASLEAWQQAMLAEAVRDLGADVGEVPLDRWQADRAWQVIRSDPGGFASAAWYRVRSFWSVVPRGDATVSAPAAVVLAGWYGSLLLVAVAGVWQSCRGNPRSTLVLLLFVASVQAVHLVYWTDTRMRSPLHPVFAVWAATAVRRASHRDA